MKEKSLKDSVLEKRYFLKDENGKIIEDWDNLCNRVSKEISYNEQEQSDFYDVMSKCDFLPNSPVLMNAGINENFTYSACSVMPLEDSMSSIMDAVKTSALISKMGGGCGFNFSVLRPKDFPVGSTGGVASGALSFMEIFNVTCEAVKQGGKRRGAQMAILHVWHPDIEEFIDAKLQDGQYTNFNFSVGITDDFMIAVKEDWDWNLIWDNKIIKTVKAKHLWDKIINNAHKNGEPGVIFLDTINKDYVLKDVLPPLAATNPSLAKGTLILTSDGVFPIEELENKSFNVTNLDGISSKATCFLSGEREQLYEVTLDNGVKYYATKEHKWPVLNNEGYIKKTTNNLMIGVDRLPITNINQLGYGAKFTHEDGFDLMCDFPHFKLKAIFPEYIWKDGSEEFRKGYLEGLFSNKCCRIKQSTIIIEIENNKDFLDNVSNLLGFYGIKSSIYLNTLTILNESIYLFRNTFKLTELDGFKQKMLTSINAKCNITTFSYKVEKVRLTNRFEKVWDISVFDDTHTFKLSHCITGNCGETPLHPNECCVLGSINLSNSDWVDWDKLDRTIKIAVRFLDNIIDKQQYPDKEFESFHKLNRKIGLGVMGFADLLIKLGIKYGSEESFTLAEHVMAFIQSKSHEYSEELANEKGIPENLKKTNCKRRNATVTCIAPTGTLSIIAECSSGIEPNFAFEIHHNRIDDKHVTYHSLAEQYEGKSLPGYFITAQEIDTKNHIKMQSVFQKYTDLAVSKTINLSNSASIKDVKEAYESAYELGCKGVTVYRDGSRGNQVLSTPQSKENNKELPQLMDSKRMKINTIEGKVFINVSHVNDKPYEVFIHHPAETIHAETYESLARLISICLRNNVGIVEIIDQMSKAHKKYGSINSVCNAVIKALKLFESKDAGKEKCPKCNEVITLEEGCKKCYNCGHSACS